MSFSCGTLAKQANGAVTVSIGETSVFVSTVAASQRRPGQDFFPLTVDYRERFAAAGRFPGGYHKREGRPNEKEILTSRLCDRPLRPLFPKGFMNEVQVIGLLMSSDLVNEPDILMINGASAALMISDIPWNGPVGCVRIGQIGDEFVVNPTNDQIFDSSLDLLYVGNEKEMMMIEGSADQIPEAEFFKALEFAHEAIQPIIQAQKDLAAQCAKQKRAFELVVLDPQVKERCEALAGEAFDAALEKTDKQERRLALEELQSSVSERLQEEMGEADLDPSQVRMAFEELQETRYRSTILEKNQRADGRTPDALRSIEMQTSVLPRVHGSSVFQRGETQAIATATLGTGRDQQELDGLTGGAKSKSFLLHYNFPPFSVGECGRFGFTSRREIGHGNLAERSLLPVIPTEDAFPYSLRVTSDVMESNGSSSMATICAGCLSLMDAGVPIRTPVAGISVGLVTKQDASAKISKHVLLTDITGAEDHFGDMDFKVAGTREGITGFQLDLKIQGLPFDLAQAAIKRATQARYDILDLMAQELKSHRQDLSQHAPRIHSIQIDPEKIGLVIGPGGKTIRKITEVSGADIEINEDNSGRIMVYATGEESMQRAISEIEALVAEIEVGKIYRGIVRGVREFGAFVECLPGKEGLVHVSELADFRVEKTEDVCKMGDEMIVKCIDIDERGRVRLSRKAAMAQYETTEAPPV